MHAPRRALSAALLIAAFSTADAHADAAVILTTHNLPPYGSTQADGSFRGVAADVVACVFKGMKRKYRNLIVPWKRPQIMVRRNKAAGFYAGSRNAERDSYAVASAIIADQKWMWYLTQESPWDPSTENFKANANVASFAGANMHKWLKDNGYRVTFNPKTHEQLIKMVAHGRLDAALVNNYVGAAEVAKLGLKDRFRTVVNRDKPLVVHFSKAFLAREPGFLDAFNAQVPGCRASVDSGK